MMIANDQLPAPTVYICNTDADTFDEFGLTPDVGTWLRNGCAYCGGRKKFREQFEQAEPGAYIVAYQNGAGVVAVGAIAEGPTVKTNAVPEYYLGVPPESDYLPEYCLNVEWLRDLRHRPLTRDELRRACGYGKAWSPLQAWARLLPNMPARRADLVSWVLPFSLPDELPADIDPSTFAEGTSRTVVVNAFERSAAARQACIAHWGTRCSVCDLDMAKQYGEPARGYIHVHHVKPIASIGREYRIDPRTDLRPVCPNCHAMLHLGRGENPRTIEELRETVTSLALDAPK